MRVDYGPGYRIYCVQRGAELLVFGDIARAKGMTQVARDAGLRRESLYKALSPEGSPELATVMKVVKALGLSLHARPCA
ncbi:MAG: putative addiction module antidote protein [Coriobacteriia bacterium]|nr:putative addiction module antidote protein [Coriobacteriia bacterium]